MTLDLTATIVFVALFLFVTWLGFVAARWRKADLNLLHEWGLGGRRFGTMVTWFLLGGDLYTAYTFIAVPALVFGKGAMGFFAVPYTILIYPILYIVFPRLWEIAHARGHVTAADFVRDRFGSRLLALAFALTGIVATMPYIALQLVGMEVVIGALGFPAGGLVGTSAAHHRLHHSRRLHLYQRTRAPALIAVVKDMLIFVTVFAALVDHPGQARRLRRDLRQRAAGEADPPAAVRRQSRRLQRLCHARARLGRWRCFSIPHAMTGILSSSSGNVIRRNAALLAAYSFILGLIALLGYMAIAAGVDKDPAYAAGFAQYGANFAVPALFLASFPSWFVGVAFAAIAIGALVPAAIMSIACANLFTRNLYKEFFRPIAATPTKPAWPRSSRSSSRSARWCSSSPFPKPTPSSFSCSAASGSFSFCRRSCSASIRAASMRWRCCSAGPRAPPSAPIWRPPKALPRRSIRLRSSA